MTSKLFKKPEDEQPEDQPAVMSDDDFYKKAWFELNEAAGAFSLPSEPMPWTLLADAFVPVLTALALNAGALDITAADVAARQVWDEVRVNLSNRRYPVADFVLDLSNGIRNRKYR